MKRIILLGSVTLLCAGSAFAETYIWEDAAGTIHFTEDLTRVPAKYRKKVRVRGDVSSEASIKPEEESQAGETQAASSAPAKTENPKITEGREKSEVRYGGKSGDEWRQDFAYLKADLRSTTDQISELNGRLADTSAMSRSDYLNIYSSLKSLQLHKSEVEKKLDALGQAASNAGVPAEFR